jgi:hypothetical protein
VATRKRTQIRFERGQASAKDLQKVVDEVLTELRRPASESVRLAKQSRLDPSLLADAEVSVGEEGHAVDPVITPIVVGIVVAVSGHAANRFWDDVIWPRVKKRLGGLAVGKKKAAKARTRKEPPVAKASKKPAGNAKKRA